MSLVDPRTGGALVFDVGSEEERDLAAAFLVSFRFPALVFDLESGKEEVASVVFFLLRRSAPDNLLRFDFCFATVSATAG